MSPGPDSLSGLFSLVLASLSSKFSPVTAPGLYPGSLTKGKKERMPFFLVNPIKASGLGTSLVVQWVGLRAPNAGGPGSIPGQETRPRMHAGTTKKNKQTKESQKPPA